MKPSARSSPTYWVNCHDYIVAFVVIWHYKEVVPERVEEVTTQPTFMGRVIERCSLTPWASNVYTLRTTKYLNPQVNSFDKVAAGLWI